MCESLVSSLHHMEDVFWQRPRCKVDIVIFVVCLTAACAQNKAGTTSSRILSSVQVLSEDFSAHPKALERQYGKVGCALYTFAATV